MKDEVKRFQLLCEYDGKICVDYIGTYKECYKRMEWDYGEFCEDMQLTDSDFNFIEKFNAFAQSSTDNISCTWQIVETTFSITRNEIICLFGEQIQYLYEKILDVNNRRQSIPYDFRQMEEE